MKLIRKNKEINTSTMADIAFLLLIFFLVSTTLLREKGLNLKLPPKPEDQATSPIRERNLFSIRINSANQFLVEGEVRATLDHLKEEVKAFVLNEGIHPELSESPQKAVVSLKTDRGTNYKTFIDVLDEIKGAYYEIYSEKAGLTSEEYRKLNPSFPDQLVLYNKGKEGIPMNISIAEPNQY